MNAPETPAATPGQAAYVAAASWEHESFEGSPYLLAAWERLSDRDRKCWDDVAAAALAARQPQPAPGDVPAGIRSAVTGLIGMWDGMRKVHAPSGAEWEDWRAVLGALVEELASQLDGEPQPAPELAAAPELREAMAETRQLRDWLDDFTRDVDGQP